MDLASADGAGTNLAAWADFDKLANSARLQEAAGWWDALAGNGPAPAAAAKESLPATLRPSAVLMDVLDGARDFRLSLVGERVKRFTETHRVGARASTVFGPLDSSKVMADLQAAVGKRRPVLGAPGYAGSDTSITRALHLVLPLTDATGAVTQLLVVVDFLAEGPLTAPHPDALAPPPGWRRRALGAFAVLFAAFLGAGGYLYHLLEGLEHDRLLRQSQHLQGIVGGALRELERDIATVAARIADGKIRDLADFQRLNDTLFSTHPAGEAIRAVALAVEVDAEAPETFSGLVQRLVSPDLARLPWPPTSQAQRYPALLIWRDHKDPKILGYDAYSNTERRAALQRTFSSGGPQVSAPVVLSQDAGGGPAPVSALLVHRIAGPFVLQARDDTLVQPTSAAIAIGVTLNDVVVAALGPDRDDINLLVFDAGLASGAPSAANGEAVPILSVPDELMVEPLEGRGTTAHLTFAGRSIGLWLEPRAFFARNLAESVSAGLIALGFLLSGSAALFVYRAGISQATLERQVAQRTLEIATLNRELTAKANQAITADTAKSRLLATLSHELRTPLNGILGFTDLLRLRFDSLSPERQHSYIDTVAEAGQHMQRVITRFLELSQDTPRAESLNIERLPLDELGSWLEAMLRPTAEKFGVRLEVALGNGRPAAVHADRVALRQALLNFIDNAVKFTPAGGSVRVEAVLADNGAVLRVADTGVGMPPARLAALEEPLAGGGTVPVHGSAGLGLGLTLSRSLLALMDFDMEVRSSVGEGTTVEVRIPAHAVELAERRPTPTKIA